MDFKTWCRHYFPKGSFSDGGKSYSCINHYRGEKNASLSFTNEGEGLWHDFAEDRGGLVRFFAKEHGLPVWDGATPWREDLPRGNDIPAPPPRPEPEESAEDAAKTAHAQALWSRAAPAEDHAYLVDKRINGDRL